MTSMGVRLSLIVGLAAVLGCGSSGNFPKTYPVKGSVKVNGKPVDGAVVTFQLDGGKENAIGSTDAKGEFTLSMFRPSDGAVPGKYIVAISKVDATAAPTDTPPAGVIGSPDLPADYAPPKEEPRGPAPTKKSIIPAKYSNNKTSGLQVTVTESAAQNVFDFDLK